MRRAFHRSAAGLGPFGWRSHGADHDGNAPFDHAATRAHSLGRKIIAELEAGRLPWLQPWAASGAPLGLPKNAATNRPYSGINVLLLWGAVAEHGFSTQSWLTFRQALSLNGHVRAGEHGTTVVYADRFIP